MSKDESLKNKVEEEAFKEEATPIFNENPMPYERHPVNFIAYFGEILGRYRRSLPMDERGASKFGQHMRQYTGKIIDRNRIARAEKGDTSVTFEVYASYISEMNAWPDILSALESGHTNSLRYLLLLEGEMDPEIKEAINSSERKLKKRMKAEKDEAERQKKDNATKEQNK